MSVSSNLLCSFELLKPLDSSALKSHIKKGRNQRNSAINSPVSNDNPKNVERADLNSLRKYQHKASSRVVPMDPLEYENELSILGELQQWPGEGTGNGVYALISVLERTSVLGVWGV